MSLQNVINLFQGVLNRDDCSADQALGFVNLAMNRLGRELRLPTQERVEIITPTAAIDWVAVPQDLIALIDIMVQQQDGTFKPLKKTSYRELLRMDPNLPPTYYARLQGQFWVRGQITAGTTIQLIYTGEVSALATLSSSNEYTEGATDACVYGALSYAADSFDHPSADRWEARYQAIVASLNAMTIALEMEGGPSEIQPAYYVEED